MKKRILATLLAAVLAIGLAAPALALPYGQEYIGYTAEGGQQYSDVPTTHWAYSSIETCSQRGWFNGYPDGTFRPNGLIRRDEAAKVFAVAMSLTLEENPTVTYTDTANSWAKAHIEATKALFPNVANLQGTASFRPDQTITREETIYALLVAWRYASKTTNADLSVLNMFSDVNSISAGVKPYVAVAVSEGLVSGLPDGTIAAQKGLTRAEFAALLARALSHGYGSDTTDTPVITVNRYAAETTEERVTLTGKVSPVSTGTKLTLNEESVALNNGSFKVTVALELGENSFTLETKNTYGVRDSKVVRITRTEPEPEPSPEPVPSPTPSAEPTKEPEPTKQPEPSKQPEPTKDPQPTKQPDPSKQPEPVKDPEPSKEPDNSGLVIDPNREVVNTGKCGTNIYYVLYADGELVISGTGKMEDYEYYAWAGSAGYSKAPWNKSSFSTVTISEGITRIGNAAFLKCKDLVKATLPSTIVSIGDYVFFDSGVVQVNLPNGLTTIGEGAFEYSALKKVDIPNSVTNIAKQAFYGSELTSVVLPDGITNIKERTFCACSPDSVTIPDSVTTIGKSAFWGNIKDVYYSGSPQQWADIVIADDNSSLTNATIHFNSTGN